MKTMIANVDTTEASRLINRLCKHFSHKIEADWNEQEGHLVFSIGECDLTAQAQSLAMTCRSQNQASLDELGDVVASHLIRFAGDRVTEVNWQPA